MTTNILNKLEHDLFFNPSHIPNPMQGDPYILASALQKAIRRGDTDTALSAAVGLWEEDRQRFYRRIHISALEDVGIGNIAAVTEVLVATASSAWRRKIGDLKVALHLVQLLCNSSKSRMGDEVFIQAEKSHMYQTIRVRMSMASVPDLKSIVLDGSVPLIERVLAVWALAGTRRYPSDNMPIRVGTLEDVANVFSELPVPKEFSDACLAVATRTPWPLAIHAPLILAEAKRHTLITKQHALSAPRSFGGVPFYALDQFTRLGKRCVQKLQKAVPDLKLFSASQIGHGIFYIEGCLVDQHTTSPAFEGHRQAGEIADMEATGLCFAEHMALRECLKAEWAMLDDIRHTELQRYVKEKPWKAA